MRKSKILLVVLLLILIILIFSISYLVKSNNKHFSLDSLDTKEIANVVNHYYTSLEKNNYDKALSYVEASKKDEEGYFISYKERIKVLENIMKNYYIKFHSITACDSSRIYFSKDEKMIAACVAIDVEDKFGNKESLNEILFFKEIDGKWKINKIESSEDVLLPYRTKRFEIDK